MNVSQDVRCSSEPIHIAADLDLSTLSQSIEDRVPILDRHFADRKIVEHMPYCRSSFFPNHSEHGLACVLADAPADLGADVVDQSPC